MTLLTKSAVDRDRDVLVASFDVTMTFAHGRKRAPSGGDRWNVFLGSALIDHFEDRDAAIKLARKVAARSRRPAWISTDGVTFDSLDSI